MAYSKPKQSRSHQTEQRFLDALASLLVQKSFHETSVADIAEASGMTRGAFMTRFGSKRGALTTLFGRFCDDVYKTLERIESEPIASMALSDLCCYVSSSYEALVRDHWGSNHAMQELFLIEGEIDEQTKAIFKATVHSLFSVLTHRGLTNVDKLQVYAAVQLLVTINYNYVLGAMPGLPPDHDVRQRLIASLMMDALGQ